MKKRFLAVMAVTGILALGACEQDPVMDELEQDVELNQAMNPDNDDDDNEDEEEYKPGEKVGNR